MEVSVQQQMWVFLLSILLGAGLGVLYDAFRLLRLMVRFGPVSVFLQDILFWAAATAVTFGFIYAVNSGEVRWYILFGVLMGAVTYHLTLGELFIRIMRAVVGFLRKVLARVASFVFFPFIVISRRVRPHARLYGRRMKKKRKIFGNLFKTSPKHYTMKKTRWLSYTESSQLSCRRRR